MGRQEGIGVLWRVFTVFGFISGLLMLILVGAVWLRPEVATSLVDLIIDPPTSIPIPPPPPSIGIDQFTKLKQQVESQTAVFANEKDELDYLTRLTVLMMTVVGIYAIILGVVSWKALDSQRADFERTAKESLEHLEKLRAELQLDFPMLGRIQRNFKSILLNLREACQHLDVRDESFSELSDEDVQRILFYENAITTALLMDTRGSERDLSEIYRLLGVFYGSRFYSTIEGNKFGSPKGQSRDYFFRAQFYFDRAIELDPERYDLFMTAGHFSQYYDDPRIASLSQSYFKRANQIGTQFQKPLVSIAMIQLEAFQNATSALDALKNARSRKRYDNERDLSRPQYIAYFECCALCLKGKGEKEPQRQSTLKAAVAKLSEALEPPSEDWRGVCDMIEADQAEYFGILESDPQIEQTAKPLLEKLKSLASGGVSPGVSGSLST